MGETSNKNLSDEETEAKMYHQAKIDCVIIETLKKIPDGIAVYPLQEIIKKYHPELELPKNSRNLLKKRLMYLRAFGEETGLFEISANLEYEEKNKGKSILFRYSNIMNDAKIKLMLRSFRAVKGTPLEKKINGRIFHEKTGRRKLVHSSRSFFSDLTSDEFIRSFDNETPPEIRNPAMFRNMEVIQSAISHNKMLEIVYVDYNIEKKLCSRKNKNGEDYKYTVYPLRMVVSLGRYYLYCRHRAFTNLSCMRIDRIISCEESKKSCDWIVADKQILLSGTGNEPHFAQRLYMFTGKAERITFLTDEKHLNDVFDWFGKDIDLKKTEDNMIKVTVRADKNAMLCWAMQYSRYVKVIDPPGLVETIKKTLEEALEHYT